jgi:SAM-dependent methyltransferase
MADSHQTTNARGIRLRTEIRTDIAHPARVYDYWLGGKDNFAADREYAERALELVPYMRVYARGNRQFLARAVRFLGDSGIRQFLDIGAGLPTSPNVHEIARRDRPDAAVVYVDNDPIVYVHTEALTAKDDQTAVMQADMRDVDGVLSQAGELIDFREPAGLLLVACLHHLEDQDDPAALVARYLDALAPGSYLVLSHVTNDFAPDGFRQCRTEARNVGLTVAPRGKEAIAAMFNGRELVDPGLVLVSHWRPDGGQPDLNAGHVNAYGGVAALP